MIFMLTVIPCDRLLRNFVDYYHDYLIEPKCKQFLKVIQLETV